MLRSLVINCRLVSWRLCASTVIASLIALTLLPLAARPVRAAEPTTVVTVIKLPGEVPVNLCNGDRIALHGELTTVLTIVPIGKRGKLVEGAVGFSSILVGEDLVTHVPYKGQEGYVTFSQTVPPGGGPIYSATWFALLPQGVGPSMLLVAVLKGTVAADGTVTASLDKTYVICSPSSRSHIAT
jgi:hypothetical protein